MFWGRNPAPKTPQNLLSRIEVPSYKVVCWVFFWAKPTKNTQLPQLIEMIRIEAVLRGNLIIPKMRLSG